MNNKIKYRVIEVEHYSDYKKKLYRLQEKRTFLWWTWWESMMFWEDRFREYSDKQEAISDCMKLHTDDLREEDGALVVFYPKALLK